MTARLQEMRMGAKRTQADRRTPLAVRIAFVVAALVSSGAVAQWAVNLQRPQPSTVTGSTRYAPSYQTRLMPSESRYVTRAPGNLPSYNRGLSMRYGGLPSEGSAAYLQSPSTRYSTTPAYASAASQGGSVRYPSSYAVRPPAHAYSGSAGASSSSLLRSSVPIQPASVYGLANLPTSQSLARPVSASTGSLSRPMY